MSLLVPLLLMAAAPPPAPAPARPPTEVSSLTIYPPGPPPRLAASWPAQGAAVTPGVAILRLTFDQAMTADGFEFGPAEGGETPPCLKTPRLLNDGRTFVLLCTLRSGRHYALTLNGGQPREAGPNGFASVSERRAPPVVLTFSTTTDEPVRSLDEAMKAQGLTPLDVPVQEDPNRDGRAPAR